MLGWELPPHHTGGLGIVSYEISEQLAKQGVEIEFVLPYSADYSSINFMKVTAATPQSVEEVRQFGGIYDSEKFQLLFDDGSSEITDLRGQQDRYVSCIMSMVKYKDFDVIHMHDWLTFRAGMAAKLISGKPLIAHVHATEYDRSAGGKGNPVVRDIEYHGLMMADKVVAVSQNTKDIIVKEYGIDPHKIEVVHNAVAIDLHQDLSGSNAFVYLDKMKTHGYKVISSVGRLTIQKGLSQLMEAARRLIEIEPKVIFLFVGQGELYEELVEMAAYHRISENIIFTGWLEPNEWRDAFRISDLFVMPSVSEPFGITPLESIAYGTPVLISKQSGVSEVLESALKVDFWDIDMMVDKMHGAISSDSLRAQLLESGRNEVAQLSWQEPTQKLQAIYDQLVGGGS